jgi:hypothetical protein
LLLAQEHRPWQQEGMVLEQFRLPLDADEL